MSDLLELAARVEAAAGADRELDAAISVAIGVKGTVVIGDGLITPQSRVPVHLPRYTGSLDAALKLLPKGYHGQIQFGPFPGAWCAPTDQCDGPDNTVAATPALALTAACLRALAAQGPKS